MTTASIIISGIFGQKLEETVRYERRFGNKLAPMLVEQCVDFIRQWGLQEEGLFRLPGQANLVKELQDAFDCGEKPAFDRQGDKAGAFVTDVTLVLLVL